MKIPIIIIFKDGRFVEWAIAGCFPETAKVLLPSGDTAPIGELKSRDVVLAYDLEAGGYLPGEVEGIYQQTYSERLIINDLLITTPDQHLYMADHRWRLASDIGQGDVLLMFRFREVAVTEVRREELPRRLRSYQCVDFHQVEKVAGSM